MTRTYDPMFAVLDSGGDGPCRLHLTRGDPNTSPWCRSTSLGSTVVNPSSHLEALSGDLPETARLYTVVRRSGKDRRLHDSLEEVFREEALFRQHFQCLLDGAARALAHNLDPRPHAWQDDQYRPKSSYVWVFIRLDSPRSGVHVEPVCIQVSDLYHTFNRRPFLGQEVRTSGIQQLVINHQEVPSIAFAGFLHPTQERALEMTREELDDDKAQEALGHWIKIVGWYTGLLYQILGRQEAQSA